MSKFQIALLLLLFWSLSVQVCMLVFLVVAASSVMCASPIDVYPVCRFFP